MPRTFAPPVAGDILNPRLARVASASDDAIWMDTAVSAGGSSGALKQRRRRACHCYLWFNGVLVFFLITGVGTTVLYLSLAVGTYGMFHDELAAKWMLNSGIDHPVWVGEFGAGPDFDDMETEGGAGSYWVHMMQFMKQYDLDWAYWPINGDVWNEAEQQYDEEAYGLLEPDYTTVKRPAQLADLQMQQEQP